MDILERLSPDLTTCSKLLWPKEQLIEKTRKITIILLGMLFSCKSK
jgi:hypothetical protein